MTEVKIITIDMVGEALIEDLKSAFPMGEDGNSEWDLKMTKKLVENKQNKFLIGYVGGKIAGFLYGHDLDRFDKKKKFLIYKLCTNPAFRRQGVMTVMINQLLEILKKEGFESAWVLTEPENAPAINLYSSTGGEKQPQVFFEYKL